METDPKNNKEIRVEGAVEASNDLTEIGPAEFFDPEEFGYRRDARLLTRRDHE